MLFTLKKLFSVLLMPLSIGFILFFIALVYLFITNFKKGKLFLALSFLWLFLVGYSPFSNALVQPLEKQYEAYLNIDKNIKYVLVLGSGHTSNENLPALSQLSATALARLAEGIRIYKKLDNAKLIVSGYGGNDKVAQAFVLKEAAISLGIQQENIITQENAKDTAEEALSVKNTVGDKPFILVTSASHMPRAMKLFKAQNLKPIAAPTNFLSKDNGRYMSLPDATQMKKSEVAIHEYLGNIWHKIVKNIKFYKD